MARENLEIAVVKHIGTGAAVHKSSWTALPPKFALLNAAGQQSLVGMPHMQGKTFAPATNLANFGNAITQIGDGGIVLGTSSYANGLNIPYYGLVIAARGSEAVYTGRYRGTGAARNVQNGHFPHAPDIVLAACSTTSVGACSMRSRANTTASCEFLSPAASLGVMITGLLSDGISLGTSTSVNAAANTYDYLSLKAVSGAIAYGTYACTGAQQSITGLGFRPDCVIAKQTSHTTAATGVMATTDMIADGLSGVHLGLDANPTGAVLSLDADGFTVGASPTINESGKTTFWIAFKAGAFSVDLSRAAA